ncbi:hypothetical protein PWT90_09879 [Aphanocladium album]|nr:hypothetical protein PWT90_09879 [Aphanocladium album]
MYDCGEDDCTTCYGEEKSPIVIEEICPPSSQPLVTAIYSQDVNSVTAILSQDPNLANSLVSLKASNYKVRECALPNSVAKAFHTIEPLLLFAATIHHYKNTEKYTRDVPEESIGIIRVILHHGGRIPSNSPTRAQTAEWRNACSQYGTAVQDSPAILELCIQAGEGVTCIEDSFDGPRVMPGRCWRNTLDCAAIHDADKSMGLLLDAMLAQGCNLREFLPYMYTAARHGSNNIIDVFLSKGGVALIDSPHPCSQPDRTLLLTTASYSRLHPRNRFNLDAIPKREALVCALVDAGANIQYDRLVERICEWAGHIALNRLLSKYDPKNKLPSDEIVFLARGTENNAALADEPSLLHIASIFLNIAAVETIILYGFYNESDTCNRTPLHWLSLENNGHYAAATVEMTVETGAGTRVPVHLAVRTAQMLADVAKVQINQQDEYGRTALHYACKLKRVELIEALLALGADMSIKDNNGRTPLHAFAEERAGRHEPEPSYPSSFIAALKEHVADSVDAADHVGRTALAVACSEFSVKRIKVLLTIGANLNIGDDKSWTPLHHAMRRPQHLRRDHGEIEFGPGTRWDIAYVAMESIKVLLLAAGADPDIRNDTGQTAADVAEIEAKAAADDRKLMAEELGAMDRRAAEVTRNLDTWRALVLEEVTRAGGPAVDRVALRVLMGAVGQGGFGRGRVSAPPSSLGDAHRKAIAGALKLLEKEDLRTKGYAYKRHFLINSQGPEGVN